MNKTVEDYRDDMLVIKYHINKSKDVSTIKALRILLDLVYHWSLKANSERPIDG